MGCLGSRAGAASSARAAIFANARHANRDAAPTTDRTALIEIIFSPEGLLILRRASEQLGYKRHGSATKMMQTGAGTSAISPVGVRAPVVESMRKMTMLLDAWLAARRNLPVGSMAELRGVFPMVGYSSLSLRVPFAGSMEKTLIVSRLPRLEA